MDMWQKHLKKDKKKKENFEGDDTDPVDLYDFEAPIVDEIPEPEE